VEKEKQPMKRFIETHSDKTYDLIIIGGGISGAAVAYEAASQGYSVALVEKGDFGAATSSATSKLIHGGMRYLANGEFGLVRESLKERRTLENIAPNYVYPIPFMIPLSKKILLRNKSLLELGMILYDLLSYDKGFTWDPSKKLPVHRSLSRKKTIAREPIIGSDDLSGSIIFHDCTSIMPERLTLAFLKSAVDHGADVANYSKVEDFLRYGDRITGVIVRDLFAGTITALRGKLTINCGGPWTDILLGIARNKPGSQQIRRSEGIHMITRHPLTRHGAIGASTQSGRPCNLIPWRGHTLIGTTDREYIGDPDAYCVTREKIEEYITEVNTAFGKENLIQYSDIVYVYGGMRPLIDDQTKDVYKTSRKYEILDHEPEGLPGLITVEGGKYTTSRNLAENVLKKVNKKFKQPSKSITARKHLTGCEIPDLEAFLATAKSTFSNFPAPTVDFLARIYGTELPAVMEIACSDEQYAVVLDSDGEMSAQVLYAIREEMALTLADILIRRTGIGTLGYPGDQVLETIAQIAARELKWDRSRLEREMEATRYLLTVPA
jgi:glycerol-3-phosphate dehydrogenase